MASERRLGKARRWLASRFDGGRGDASESTAAGADGRVPLGGSAAVSQPASDQPPSGAMPPAHGAGTGALEASPNSARTETPAVARREHVHPRIPAVVPPGLRAASEWAWRFLVVVAAILLILYLLVRLRLIVFPVIVALFVTALLAPAVNRLQANGLRRSTATAVVFVGGILFLVGVGVLLGRVFADGLGDITDNVQQAVDDTKKWLAGPPFRIDDQDFQNIGDNIKQSLERNRDRIFSGAIGTAAIVGEVLTGIVLTLFTTFFFLYDGERIWRWIVALFPHRAVPHVAESGTRAWATLTGYVRGTILIALVDGGLIALLLVILRVPLAIPLGVFVFFGAFVPLVGATVTGAVAVLVALVTKGFVTALFVLAGIIGIQQLEGHVLQPFLLGRFVRVHPLAIVLGITAGAVLAGIGGAIIAVPLVAIANAVGKYFVEVAREAAGSDDDGEPGAAVAGSADSPG